MNLWAIIEGMMGVEKDKLRVSRGSECKSLYRIGVYFSM
jgi:hypothetical protein